VGSARENSADNLLGVCIEATPMAQKYSLGPPVADFRNHGTCGATLKQQRQTHPEGK
jgi:hypothetical protein